MELQVKALNKSTIRKEVLNYVHLTASRDKPARERVGPALISSLENQTDAELQSLLNFVKGMTVFANNGYQEARVLFDKAIELAGDEADLRGIAHLGLGLTCRSVGNIDEAVANMTAAIDLIYRDREFKPLLMYCNQSLGEMHTLINEYEVAIEYFNEAFAVSQGERNNMSFFRFHLGLGNCYLKMKDYEKSKDHLTKALDLKDLSPLVMARVEQDLGVLYLEIKEYAMAEELLSKSLKARESNNQEDATCTTMTSLAEVYLQQGKVPEALQLLCRCLLIVDKYQTKWKKIEVLKLMARAYGIQQNYELSARYYEQYNTLYTEIKGEQERKVFKFKNAQIEKQKRIISEKHNELAATFDEIKRLKVNGRAVFFSWMTVILLVLISELFLDPLIENYSYSTLISLVVKVMIALLFKPLDGFYEKILWDRTLRKVT